MKRVIVRNVIENWRVVIRTTFARIVVKIGIDFGENCVLPLGVSVVVVLLLLLNISYHL